MAMLKTEGLKCLETLVLGLDPLSLVGSFNLSYPVLGYNIIMYLKDFKGMYIIETTNHTLKQIPNSV